MLVSEESHLTVSVTSPALASEASLLYMVADKEMVSPLSSFGTVAGEIETAAAFFFTVTVVVSVYFVLETLSMKSAVMVALPAATAVTLALLYCSFSILATFSSLELHVTEYFLGRFLI